MNIDAVVNGIAEQASDGEGIEAWRAKEKAYEDADRRAWLKESMERMQLSKRAVACLEAGPKDTPAMEAVRERFDLRCLAGAVGTGKSVAATWWLWSMLQGGHPRASGLFVSGAQLARWPRYDGGEMKRLLTVGRLVIDDLGNEFNDQHGAALTTLSEVIITRYEARLPTLITTNLTAAAFAKRYGERIADRITEQQGFIALGGNSMRGNQSGIDG